MLSKIIEVNRISKAYKTKGKKDLVALEKTSFSVSEDEFFILVGPSGCGKSTLLRIISGIDQDYQGEVILNGIDKNSFSFVFQQFALFPWLTVYENIEMGLHGQKLVRDEKQKRVQEEIKRLKLGHFENSYPHELSGGMKQRVGIARALVKKPRVMLLDEPFSELDSFTAEVLRQELLQIWQEQKLTIILVTHIIQEAIEMGDQIAVMSSRPGKIIEIVENTLPRPRKKRSPEFFKVEDKLAQVLRI